MRIGIFGGSFDPIHIGHLILSEYVRDTCHLDRIIFVPAYIPPHKLDKRISNSASRLHMLHCAIENFPCFEVSDYELQKKSVSYTLDTISDFRKIYNPDDSLFLLIGADNYLILDTWKNPDIILTMASLLVMHRPGLEISEFKYPAKIVDTPLIEISSSEIRKRIQNHKSITYWVPSCVENYIFKEGLYVS